MEYIDEVVGRRIRARRKQIGMTQAALADELGITFQQVQKYEVATNRVSSSRLYEIATALKVQVAWFFPAIIGLMEERETFEHEKLTKEN